VSARKLLSTELNAAARLQAGVSFVRCREASPLLEIALVLVRLNHVACFIENANHGIM
jgi:hypothetical protein